MLKQLHPRPTTMHKFHQPSRLERELVQKHLEMDHVCSKNTFKTASSCIMALQETLELAASSLHFCSCGVFAHLAATTAPRQKCMRLRVRVCYGSFRVRTWRARGESLTHSSRRTLIAHTTRPRATSVSRKYAVHSFDESLKIVNV